MNYSNVKLYKLVNSVDSDIKRNVLATSLNEAQTKVGYFFRVETITKFKPGEESIQPSLLAELKQLGI
jgi:hypothetical protein